MGLRLMRHCHRRFGAIDAGDGRRRVSAPLQGLNTSWRSAEIGNSAAAVKLGMLSRNAVNATIMLRNEFFTYLLRCYVLL